MKYFLLMSILVVFSDNQIFSAEKKDSKNRSKTFQYCSTVLKISNSYLLYNGIIQLSNRFFGEKITSKQDIATSTQKDQVHCLVYHTAESGSPDKVIYFGAFSFKISTESKKGKKHKCIKFEFRRTYKNYNSVLAILAHRMAVSQFEIDKDKSFLRILKRKEGNVDLSWDNKSIFSRLSDILFKEDNYLYEALKIYEKK